MARRAEREALARMGRQCALRGQEASASAVCVRLFATRATKRPTTLPLLRGVCERGHSVAAYWVARAARASRARRGARPSAFASAVRLPLQPRRRARKRLASGAMAGSRAATSRGDDVSRGKGKARASVGVAAGERARDGDAHAGGSATAAVAPATASTRGASRAAAPSAAAAEAAAGGAAAASKIAEAEAESALLCQEVADNVMRHAPAETLAALECTASALRGRTEHAAKAQALARHPGLTLAEARRQARVGGAWAAAGAGAPARYNTRRAAAADAAHAAGPQRVPWSWKRTLRALEIYEHAAFVVGGFNKNWMSPVRGLGVVGGGQKWRVSRGICVLSTDTPDGVLRRTTACPAPRRSW